MTTGYARWTSASISSQTKICTMSTTTTSTISTTTTTVIWIAGSSTTPGRFSGVFQSEDSFHLPRDMTFTSDSLITVIFYTVLLIIGAAGNLTVFVTLFRARQRKSRVNRFIMHLCIADMTVVFIMMPLEIGWQVTVSWEAGDVACRILMFFRAFGFYLSSFILIVISLDRVFTVTHPMKLQDAEQRGKVMLILSWIMSTVASLPQVSFLLNINLVWKSMWEKLSAAMLATKWFSDCHQYYYSSGSL